MEQSPSSEAKCFLGCHVFPFPL